MAVFPSIKPTRRSFTLGEYPTKTYRSLSGKTIRRSFGNRPYGATLDLVFENVKESVLKQIYDHYHGQRGTSEGFALSGEVWAGLTDGSNLRRQLRQGEPFFVLQAAGLGNGSFDTMEWVYMEAPQVESVQRDLSTITVRLSAEFKQ
jgi:hypothetical protein